MLPIMQHLASIKYTDEQIAQAIGIGVSTLYKWKNEHPEIVEALKAGKDEVDNLVEAALLQRAQGYEYTEEEARITGEGENKKRYRKQVTKHMPPDPGAAKIWLNNRRPDVWSDKRQLEITGANNLISAMDAIDGKESINESSIESTD
jgi:hypothetical protein